MGSNVTKQYLGSKNVVGGHLPSVVPTMIEKTIKNPTIFDKNKNYNTKQTIIGKKSHLR